jgi:hypothetical protein
MPLKSLINAIDDHLIVAGLLIPLAVWSAYAIRKRGYSLKSLFFLTLAEAIPLALLGRAFVRELTE